MLDLLLKWLFNKIHMIFVRDVWEPQLIEVNNMYSYLILFLLYQHIDDSLAELVISYILCYKC